MEELNVGMKQVNEEILKASFLLGGGGRRAGSPGVSCF
jgi:hypothetical protein